MGNYLAGSKSEVRAMINSAASCLRPPSRGIMAMESPTESDVSLESKPAVRRAVNWVRMGVFATASALAVGLAAAWWYRSTLKTLRQSGENDSDSSFRISPDDSE